MNTQKHILYALAALLGTGAVVSSAGAQGYYAANGAYRDASSYSQKITGPRGASQPNVPQVQSLPVGMVAYETVPYDPRYTQAAPMAPVMAEAQNTEPKEDRDGSLFGGRPCVNCSKDGSLFGGAPCVNCSKDGSLLGGDPCVNCSKDGSLFPGPCKKCEERKIEYVQTPLIKNYVPYQPAIYAAMQHNCCALAPLALDHVDFRIKNNGIDGPYSSHLGNYRFRIFGCRRFNKEANLNSGRIMEKNIKFASVFEEVTGDCYKVLPMPQDLCLQTIPTELPEYVLTAEITDYFMNVCDEYDWDRASKNDQRNGTSEITVVWRLMDLTKNTVYWKGESTGYGELYQGEVNGEVKLIERAFADAVSNLRALPGFEDQLAMRVDPVTMAAQRYALIEEERALNPMKCGYLKEYECAKNCEISRPGIDIAQCQPMGCGCGVAPCADGSCGCATPIPQEPIIETGNVVTSHEVVDICIDENGNVREDGQCQVVDDTWIDTGDVTALENLCVVTSNPCQNLTPETVYRMRSSVVQIDSPNGRKGAGLLISDRFILTSGDLIDPNSNNYTVKTIQNIMLNARAVRVNPSKNTALLMLDQPTEYTPLALNLNLPEVGRNGYLTLGLLDVKDFKDGENYLENSARVEGYRYTEEKGAEILANTFVQNVTVGGALFYKDCTVNGMAHSGIRTDDGLDAFIPTETALRSLGICICGQEYVEESPWQQTVYKPVTEQIKVVQKAPEEMPAKERK